MKELMLTASVVFSKANLSLGHKFGHHHSAFSRQNLQKYENGTRLNFLCQIRGMHWYYNCNVSGFQFEAYCQKGLKSYLS